MSYTIFFNIITVFTSRLRSNFACHSLLPEEASGIYFPFNIVHSLHFHKDSSAGPLFRCSSISCHAVILTFAFLKPTCGIGCKLKNLFCFSIFFTKGHLEHCFSLKITSRFFKRAQIYKTNQKNSVLVLSFYRAPQWE